MGWFFPIYGKIKHVPNHQPVMIIVTLSDHYHHTIITLSEGSRSDDPLRRFFADLCGCFNAVRNRSLTFKVRSENEKLHPGRLEANLCVMLSNMRIIAPYQVPIMRIRHAVRGPCSFIILVSIPICVDDNSVFMDNISNVLWIWFAFSADHITLLFWVLFIVPSLVDTLCSLVGCIVQQTIKRV